MTEKTASPGWYPTDGGERWWDGDAWTNQFLDADGSTRTIAPEPDEAKRPWGPGAYLVVGLVISIIGGLTFTTVDVVDDEALALLGWAVSSVGALIFLIGIIAQGVLVGIRSSRSD